MEKLITYIQANPIKVYSFVQSLITVITLFGLHLSADQAGGILLVTHNLLALFAGSQVTSNVAAEKQVNDALLTEVPKVQG